MFFHSLRQVLFFLILNIIKKCVTLETQLYHITPYAAKLHVLQTSRYFIHVLGFVHLGPVSVTDTWECVKDIRPDCLIIHLAISHVNSQ